MTDDRSIEAAEEAFVRHLNMTHDRHGAIRAALAAADKVRAEEEFNSYKEAQELLESDYTAHGCTDAAVAALCRAYAAGLATGEDERAALDEALKAAQPLVERHVDPYKDGWIEEKHAVLNQISAALALVQKGE